MQNSLLTVLRQEVNPPLAELYTAHNTWVQDNSHYSNQDVVIANEAEYKVIADKLDYAKKALKQINTRRLEITAPVRDIVEKINEYSKNKMEKPLESIIDGLTNLAVNYKKKLILEEMERQNKEKARIAELEAQTRAKLEAKNKLNPEAEAVLQATVTEAKIIVEQQAPIESKKTVQTTMGKLTITSRFIFDEERSDLLELCKFILEKPEFVRFIDFNLVQINKELKPSKQKETQLIPGIIFKEDFGTRSTY